MSVRMAKSRTRCSTGSSRKTPYHPDYYSKVTYRVLNEAADAVEDMKLLLKRKYGFKRINLEEIVEIAILGIKQDLDDYKEQSILVQRLREQKVETDLRDA
jgi:hypothetical protein